MLSCCAHPRSRNASVQGFFHWLPWHQRRQRVALYQAKTGRALGAKDRHMLAPQSILVDQPSTDLPPLKVTSMLAKCTDTDPYRRLRSSAPAYIIHSDLQLIHSRTVLERAHCSLWRHVAGRKHALRGRQEVAQDLPKAPPKPPKAAARRVPKPPAPPPMPRRPTFFHSRNCEAVTPAEIDLDSDDEVDQEEWAVRRLGPIFVQPVPKLPQLEISGIASGRI